jgi:RND family efflux transporter MFP subunit
MIGMRAALLLGFVCLLVFAESACKKGGSGASSRGRSRAGAVVPVETTTVQRISIQRAVELTGTLLSPDQARVSSEAAGVVQDVPVQLGTEVRVGDALVRIDPRELQLALDRAESALRQVEAQLGIQRSQDRQPPPDEQIATVQQALANRDDARAAHARAMLLSSRGLLSQVDRDAAETRLKVMEANYQAAVDSIRALKASLQDRRASYELAQKKLNDAVIKAPVAGSVSERLVQRGEYIRENTPVVTIVQMSPLKLRTGIQEKFAGLITPGQIVQFQVEAFPELTFDGKVAYVSPAVDQATRSFPVEVFVDNSNRILKPGFFAKGTVAIKRDENVLAVPDETVSTLAGVSTVYVIENGKARQQIVTLGAHQEKVWEVLEGLKGDEVLAATNLNQLATGTTVRTDRAGDAGEDGRGDGRGGTGRGTGRGHGDTP